MCKYNIVKGATSQFLEKKNCCYIWIHHVFLPMFTKLHSATLPGTAQNKLMKTTLLEKTIQDLYVKS